MTFPKDNPRALIRQRKKAVPTNIKIALTRKILSGFCESGSMPKAGRMTQ
jgi:hypothetical protein